MSEPTAIVTEPTPKALAPPPVMYTRENLVALLQCSHGELGRMLARKMAPLPVRVDGAILWYADEVQGAQASILRTLERWRKSR